MFVWAPRYIGQTEWCWSPEEIVGWFFSSSPWFLLVFRLVPISSTLCISCSIHLLSYIISSIQVSNFIFEFYVMWYSIWDLKLCSPCGPCLKGWCGNPCQTQNYLHLFVLSHSSDPRIEVHFVPPTANLWRTFGWRVHLKWKNVWHFGKAFLKALCQIWAILRYTLWFIGWYSGHTWVTRITSISIENNLFMADFEWRASLSHSEFQAHRLSHILHCHVQIWSATQTRIAHHVSSLHMFWLQ